MLYVLLLTLGLFAAPASAEARICPTGKIYWRSSGYCVQRPYQRKRIGTYKRKRQPAVLTARAIPRQQARTARRTDFGPMPTFSAFPPEREEFYGSIVTPIWGSFAYQLNSWVRSNEKAQRDYIDSLIRSDVF